MIYGDYSVVGNTTDCDSVIASSNLVLHPNKKYIRSLTGKASVSKTEIEGSVPSGCANNNQNESFQKNRWY